MINEKFDTDLDDMMVCYQTGRSSPGGARLVYQLQKPFENDSRKAIVKSIKLKAMCGTKAGLAFQSPKYAKWTGLRQVDKCRR